MTWTFKSVDYSRTIRFSGITILTLILFSSVAIAAGTPSNSATLTWTAPGDDGSTGTATSYDIRYSTSVINDGNWAASTPLPGEPAPVIAGSAEFFSEKNFNG